MKSFGGGWTRFGKDHMSSEWNYINENEQTVTIEVISNTEVFTMQNLTFTKFQVVSDVQFRLQQDDSINPSSLAVIFLPLLTRGNMKLRGDTEINHTHLKLSQGKNCITLLSSLLLLLT